MTFKVDRGDDNSNVILINISDEGSINMNWRPQWQGGAGEVGG